MRAHSSPLLPYPLLFHTHAREGGKTTADKQRINISAADKGEVSVEVWKVQKEIRELELNMTTEIIRKAQVSLSSPAWYAACL